MIYLLATLATYRIAYMVVYETGPFGLTLWLRTLVYGRTDDGSIWQEGLGCIKCVSWWVAWVMAGMLRPSNFLEFIILSQGLAGAAIVVHFVAKYLEMMPMTHTMAEIMKEHS